MKGHSRDARCSFCGKPQDRVRRPVAGPGVYICNQCVELCNQVLNQDAAHRPPTDPRGPGRWIRRIFGPKPPHTTAWVVGVPD